jgi:phosphoglycerate dehydrogenase-like enzyme
MANSRELVDVLISARVTAQQLKRMQAVHPRLVIHGEPGGIAIMPPAEAAAHGIDVSWLEYPEFRPDLDYAGLLARAEVLVAHRIPPDLVARAPHLRWIQFTSAGVDHLWQPSLGEPHLTVTSAKGIHAYPMAEFVMSCLLVFTKGWRRLLRQQNEHRWNRFVLDEVHGKTIVLLGAGEIARGIARLAKVFGMHVIGVRRRESSEGLPPELDEHFSVSALEQLLPRGDYIVASLPLTAKTRGLLNEQAFRAMKPSAIFVNVGRGRTVDQKALVRALQEGWIAGAALDVFEREPLSPDDPIWDVPNLLVSPHMGPDTPMYMERMTDLLCDQLLRYAESRPLRNVVDPQEGY